MTKIPEKPFGDTWRSLPFSAKSSLVRKFAAYSACLFRNQLRGIGNIYGKPCLAEDSLTGENPPNRDLADTENSLRAQTPISDEIPDVHQNQCLKWAELYPTSSSGGLTYTRMSTEARFVQARTVRACLMFNENDCHSILAEYPTGVNLDSDDEDEVDDATRTLHIIDKLKPLLSVVFPTNDNDPEPPIMIHDDLSRHNILVSEDGELTAVLDWECVSALPLWKASYYPSFLQEKPRHAKPNIRTYHREADGEPYDLYWIHLWEYEATILREIFIEEMKHIEPGWVEVFNKSQTQRDLDFAAHNCDHEFMARNIKEWVEDITTGKCNCKSLCDRIYEV